MYLKAFIHLGEIYYSLVHSSLQTISQVAKGFCMLLFWVHLEARTLICGIGNI